MNLAISFQRYDRDFNELVDLEDGDEVTHLEKRNVVVTPVLVTRYENCLIKLTIFYPA